MNNIKTMDEKYMRQALGLAKKGLGFTHPNPPVGAVIVKDGTVIGSGYHHQAGMPHAEVEAFNSLEESAEGATIYVTLEPCCHEGRTPPCTKRIIEEKIGRVVIGSTDPNPKVAGKGLEQLEEAGIEVCSGVLEKQTDHLIRCFRKHILRSRPYVFLKMAMTLDGKIANKQGESKWITNEKSRKYVHVLRHQMDAIMVGTNTALNDNPFLTVRLENTKRQPDRVIIDMHGRVPLFANCFMSHAGEKIYVVISSSIPEVIKDQYRDQGLELIEMDPTEAHSNLHFLMIKLAQLGISSLLVEGGSALAGSFVKEELVDEMLLFIAPKMIGEGIPVISGWGVESMKNARKVEIDKILHFGKDILLKARFI